jgi:hypothetical protein
MATVALLNCCSVLSKQLFCVGPDGAPSAGCVGLDCTPFRIWFIRKIIFVIDSERLMIVVDWLSPISGIKDVISE